MFDVAFVGETTPQGLEYPSPKFQQESVLSSPTKKGLVIGLWARLQLPNLYCYRDDYGSSIESLRIHQEFIGPVSEVMLNPPLI